MKPHRSANKSCKRLQSVHVWLKRCQHYMTGTTLTGCMTSFIIYWIVQPTILNYHFRLNANECLNELHLYISEGKCLLLVSTLHIITYSHCCMSLYYNAFQQAGNVQIVLFHGGILAPPNIWFLGPTRVYNANGISISSAIFARLTVVSNRHTDRETGRQCYYCSKRPHLCTPCMRCSLIIHCLFPDAFSALICLQCFDAVGCAAGRASGL